jgi:hypothetical protein
MILMNESIDQFHRIGDVQPFVQSFAKCFAVHNGQLVTGTGKATHAEQMIGCDFQSYVSGNISDRGASCIPGAT